jgi:small subunit ribosomal protein S6
MMENLYCTVFIVDISQNPEEVDTVSSRIQQLIEDHGGIIKRVNPWGKQKLAYPIQNRNYAFYVEIEFTANSHLNIPNIIEQEYRINDRVLRYLTYVVTKKELQQREINAARMKQKAVKTDEEEEVKTPRAEDKSEDEQTDSGDGLIQETEMTAPASDEDGSPKTEEEKLEDEEKAQDAVEEKSGDEEKTQDVVEEKSGDEEKTQDVVEEKIEAEKEEVSEDKKE